MFLANPTQSPKTESRNGPGLPKPQTFNDNGQGLAGWSSGVKISLPL